MPILRKVLRTGYTDGLFFFWFFGWWAYVPETWRPWNRSQVIIRVRQPWERKSAQEEQS